MIKVAVGLSGGVDSAVCTLLLKEQGYQPLGVYLRMHKNEQEEAAARQAALELDIPFHIADLTALFEEQVIRPFAALYKRGETPNPCLLCNPAVKFKGLLQVADDLGCEKIATGHYAIVDSEAPYLIGSAADAVKDQSYMLYGLDEACRSRLLLPLGVAEGKGEVRAKAAKTGLFNASKKDSLDICFLEPDCSHADFIAAYTGSEPQAGEILDPQGKRLGYHNGICRYTVGQRRGLGIAASERLYVVSLNPEENTVILGPRSMTEQKEVKIRNLILHCPLPEEGLSAKVRYHDRITPVRLERCGEEKAVLHFDTPKSAPAPGQSAVFYCGNRVVGGGIIER